jgi:integrase
MRIFRQVLNIAVKWDIISNNPSLKINLPKLQKKEQAILTPEELSVLLMSSNDRDKSIIALAALAGLRRGEIFGLQWDDIDIKNNKIFLRRQYHNGEIKSLKTDKSQIILPTMKKLSLMLAEWKLQSGSHLWVYAGKNNKPLYPDTWVAKIFKKLLQENDLPQIRFHDLRHTFVSLLISKGVSTPDVQRLARHSSYQTTIDIYRHLLPNQLESILEELNDSIAIRRTKRRTVQ